MTFEKPKIKHCIYCGAGLFKTMISTIKRCQHCGCEYHIQNHGETTDYIRIEFTKVR